jgi:hypothetical protein
MAQVHEDHEEEVAMVRGGLANLAIGSVDWVQTIAAAPRAIGILGECLLLTSHRKALSVELKETGLP